VGGVIFMVCSCSPTRWDGHGMAATQSHALRFEDFPATHIAWPGQLSRLQEAAGGHNHCLFTAAIVGIAASTWWRGCGRREGEC
jgi:hypothetical protein